MRTIIAIDFDGTIVDHRYPLIGEPAPGAFHWMKRFQEMGALLILYTMRSDNRKDGSTPLCEASRFCNHNGVHFWATNFNPEQHTWTESPKIYAHRYIDDAAIGVPLCTPEGFHGPVIDWGLVGPMTETFIMTRLKA